MLLLGEPVVRPSAVGRCWPPRSVHGGCVSRFGPLCSWVEGLTLTHEGCHVVDLSQINTGYFAFNKCCTPIGLGKDCFSVRFPPDSQATAPPRNSYPPHTPIPQRSGRDIHHCVPRLVYRANNKLKNGGSGRCLDCLQCVRVEEVLDDRHRASGDWKSACLGSLPSSMLGADGGSVSGARFRCVAGATFTPC